MYDGNRQKKCYKPTTVRMTRKLYFASSPSFQNDVVDGKETLSCNGKTKFGSYDIIVSPNIADKAVLNGIGKLKKIKTVTIQVALKEGEQAETFTFSRIVTLPRTIFRLAAGPLELRILVGC